MPTQLSHDYVVKYFKKYNYIMQNTYINSKIKNDVICPVGHEIKISFNTFSRGNRCKFCANRVKYTQDFVYKFYKENGYTLNSIYKGNKNKDKLTCPVGHEILISFDTFKNKKTRCAICAGVKQLSQDFVSNYYCKYNYILKSTYKNSANHDSLVCPVGHEIKMTFSNFKNNGYRCNICYRENNFGENHPNYNPDRTRKKRALNLSFNHYKINILHDDPNYHNYLNSRKNAKKSKKIWAKSEYTIDHIYPRIAFIDNDLDEIYDRRIIKKICNLRENLRIIPKLDNMVKSSKYNQEEFMEWFNNKLKEGYKI